MTKEKPTTMEIVKEVNERENLFDRDQNTLLSFNSPTFHSLSSIFVTHSTPSSSLSKKSTYTLLQRKKEEKDDG